MRKLLAITVATAFAVSCFAQTGTYSWQLSVDGNFWNNTANVAAATLVHVRLLASWSGVTGTDIGFAGGQFDVVVMGASASSTISNIVRPAPFAFAAQTLVATSYGSGQKIDISSDFAPPGAGTGWVNPGQVAAEFANVGEYNSNNPAIVFTFDITANDNMTFSMVLNQLPGRAMAIYSGPGGTQVRMNASAVTVNTATIPLPSIGTLAACVCSSLIYCRRRSRSNLP